MKYQTLTTIWHSKDNKHYEAGEIVSMEHLDPLQVDSLVKGGVIAPVEDEKQVARPMPRESKEG